MKLELQKPYFHRLYCVAGMGGRKLLRELLEEYAPKDLYDLLQRENAEELFSERLRTKLEKLTGMLREYREKNGDDVEAEYAAMCRRGIKMVIYPEKEYPERLRQIPDAPLVLYIAGSLPVQERKSVAIIGARNCSEYGRCMAKHFGEALGRAGIQVISGMARGIDGIGQTAALLAGGYSLAVLGSGVDVCYPRENSKLYEMLLEKGGICAEYPPQTAPRPILFPPRNRIISGLSDCVLVIEAREKSGTLITVDMALEQGRDVYAIPGRVTDPLSRGCNRLLKQGAILVEEPEELVHILMGEGSCSMEKKESGFAFANATQKRVAKLLDYEPQAMELLRMRYEGTYHEEISIPDFMQEMLQLCALGYAKRIGGGYYVKST